MRFFLSACFLLVLSCSAALADKAQPDAKPKDILRPLAPYLQQFKELAAKDAMLTRVASAAVKERNLSKLVEVLRTQSIVRSQEIENRSLMLEALCASQGDACAKARANLQSLGTSLQTALTDMRVAMAGRPLTSEESAGVLHAGVSLQKSCMDALLDILRYTLANSAKAEDKEKIPGLFSLRDLPELSDIPMLPPPPMKGDMRLGK